MALTRLLARPLARTADNGPAVARVIAFANQKGGVAKTTTTLTLGVALAEQGMRVLAIDLDPQGNLTMSQGWNPDEIDRSMFDVLCHRLPITEIVRTNELDVAVSSIDLAGAELALASMIGRERELRTRSEEHTSELQSHVNLVCRLLLEKKKKSSKHTISRSV